ncbi:MAG: hypothetical protein ACYCTE_05510, partial [Acidimicrobiales bacterium]
MLVLVLVLVLGLGLGLSSAVSAGVTLGDVAERPDETEGDGDGDGRPAPILGPACEQADSRDAMPARKANGAGGDFTADRSRSNAS